MSAAEIKAVFLSYASQDAEAAKRICDSLRSGGVEVWFDADGGLEHGDEWDAKIRRQIKECVLFIPVISANTQARHEGYFRIEWDLAAERARGIASGVPFILPVVIDDTREPDALVPDRFRAVQWTRLRGGDVPPEVQQRFLKLWSHRTGVLKSQSATSAAANESAPLPPSAPSPAAKLSWPPWLLAVAAALVVTLALWQPWKKSPVAPSQSAAPAPAASAPKSGPETAADLADQALSHYYPFSMLASLQLADELSRRATELDPRYARGWGTRANASARYLLRALVSGEAAQARARDAQSFANRALNLDKNEPEALVALGIVAMHQHASTQAETLFRRVLAVDPNNVQAPSLLSMVLRETGRDAEALPLMKRAVANAPRDPVAHLFLGFAYWSGWNFTKAAEQFDTAATIADFPNARVYQAWVVFLQTGDLARLRSMLESVDLIYSAEDGKLTYLLACGLYERRADRVIEAAGRTASAYFDAVAMPKAWFSGLAYEFDRKDNLARQQWLAAEAVIRERLRADPQSEMLRMNLAITLAKLGRTTEARTEFDAVEVVWREQPTASHALWLARFHAAVGDAPRAVALLRQCVNRLGDDAESFQNTTTRTLQFDPWWDPIRTTPEFRELVAHPPEPPASVDDEPAKKTFPAETKPDDKSVAVLAFANLSDDKNNEYFSDGISEELLNVLAKIPELKVSARTSAFYFKDKQVPLPEIARQLGVAYVVEGSVRKSGSKVRITAQLIKAADGFHVWSDNFDRELKDIFAVQDEIAGLIAKNLQLKMGVSSATRLVNPEAYALFLQGRAIMNRGVPKEYAKAIQYFKDSLAIDGGSALSQAWLSLGYASAALQGGTQEVAATFALAREAATRALALDPELGEGHTALGSLQFLVDWDWARAEASLQHALSLAPGDANALSQAANLAQALGQMERAVQLGRKALDLDPLNYFPAFVLGKAYFRSGRYAEMEKLAQQMIAVNPAGGNGPMFLVFARLLQGQIAAAAQTAEQMGPAAYQTRLCLALVRHAQDRAADSEAVLQELKAGMGPARGYEIAEVYAYRGEVDHAFEWLENSYRDRDYGLTWLIGDPFMQSLHSDRRWSAFLKKMNLPDTPPK